MAKELEKALYQQEKRIRLYEEILDKVLQGIFIIDGEDNIVWFNSVAELMDGVRRSDLIGKKNAEVWKDINIQSSAISKTYRSGQPSDEQLFTYIDASGKENSIFFQSFPFYDKGKMEYVYSLGYYIDYSEKQLNKIAEYRQKYLKHNSRVVNSAPFTLYDIIGGSNIMRHLTYMARKVAVNNPPVLLYGETGTGKELFAQGIHNASLFRKGPFVAVNCAALPENLLESILFGSVKGAFTGATDNPGLLEEANNGTLFLDELNSLPLTIQGKLLRVLQVKQASRLGDHRIYQTNCRIISATNHPPKQLLDQGKLRSDLYYRLAVVTLEIPPLRERENDLAELTNYFIQKYNSSYQLQVASVAPSVREIFALYNWPGNVRELEHVIEYMMNFVAPNQHELTAAELPQFLKEVMIKNNFEQRYQALNKGSLRRTMDEFEKMVILKTLEETDWNISFAARQLAVSRENLHYYIKKFALRKE